MREAELETVALLLQEVHRLIKECSSEFLAQNEISLGTIIVLRYLDEHPGLTLSEISRLTHLSKGYVSVRVDQLVRAGHVRKLPDNIDQRRTRLQLTESGRSYWLSLQQDYRSFMAELLEPVPSTAIPEIIASLQLLRNVIRGQLGL